MEKESLELQSLGPVMFLEDIVDMMDGSAAQVHSYSKHILSQSDDEDSDSELSGGDGGDGGKGGDGATEGGPGGNGRPGGDGADGQGSPTGKRGGGMAGGRRQW